MDTSEEERAKGKTVEVGRAHFETEKKRYTVLDAPGHKNYVPNMIAGAAQADVGVLVIAARKGEFETGFERGGQTREHAQLAKTLGVTKLIVLVNKMDDPTVKWDKGRWDEINVKISPFLKSCGYNPKDVQFVPVSGLYGTNMKTKVDAATCAWYEGKSFFQTLDDLDPLERNPDAPFRLPVLDKHKDMGTIVMGKTEAGTVRRGDKLVVMPNNVKVQVTALFRDCGVVREFHRVRDHTTRAFNGCAIITFGSEEAANLALKKDGAAVRDNVVAIRRAKARRAKDRRARHDGVDAPMLHRQ